MGGCAGERDCSTRVALYPPLTYLRPVGRTNTVTIASSGIEVRVVDVTFELRGDQVWALGTRHKVEQGEYFVDEREPVEVVVALRYSAMSAEGAGP